MPRHPHDQELPHDTRDQSEFVPGGTDLEDNYQPLTPEQVETGRTGARAARRALAMASGRVAVGRVERPEPVSPLQRFEDEVAALADLAGTMTASAVEATETSAEPKPKQKPVRHAFGWYVKPEQYNPFGDYDLSGLTDDEKALVDPVQIESSLLNPPKKADFTVYHAPYSPALPPSGRVAVLPIEFNMIAGSPEVLANRTRGNLLDVKDLTDDRVAASARGGRHAVEGKQEKVASRVSELETTRRDIQRLIREARKPGFTSDLVHEQTTSLIATAWNEFTNMLDVLHVQKGWNEDTRKKAETALIYYLTQGDQRQRVGHWQQMLDLSNKYLTARIITFKNHNRRLKEVINTLQAQEPAVEPEADA